MTPTDLRRDSDDQAPLAPPTDSPVQAAGPSSDSQALLSPVQAAGPVRDPSLTPPGVWEESSEEWEQLLIDDSGDVGFCDNETHDRDPEIDVHIPGHVHQRCWECAKCIRTSADVRSITQTPAQTRAPTQDAVHVACPRWCAAACSICRPNSDDEWTIVRGSPSPPSVENLHNKYGLRKGDPMMNNLPSKRTAGDSKPPARRQKVDNDAQVDGWCFAILLYVSLTLCLPVSLYVSSQRLEGLNC